MLPASSRLVRREDFAMAVRRGRRAARGAVVVHLARPAATPGTDPQRPPRVGFVVGRAVGGAVQRHRVQRRLRHLMRARLDQLPRGAVVVVRALPTAATARSRDLGADLDAALYCLAQGRLAQGRPSEDAVGGAASPGES